MLSRDVKPFQSTNANTIRFPFPEHYLAQMNGKMNSELHCGRRLVVYFFVREMTTLLDMICNVQTAKYKVEKYIFILQFINFVYKNKVWFILKERKFAIYF